MTQKGELTWPRPQSWLGGGPGFGPRGSDCRSYWLECILASQLCVLLLSFSFSKMMSVLFCFLFCEDKHKVFETLNIMDTWRFQFCEKSDIFTPLGVPPPRPWPLLPYWKQLSFLPVSTAPWPRHHLEWNGHSFALKCTAHTQMWATGTLPSHAFVSLWGQWLVICQRGFSGKGMWLMWLHTSFFPWRLGVIGLVVRKSG